MRILWIDPLGAWRDQPNIFVARTFSKAYGLAGLRIGVLAGEPTTLASVRRVASPYSVNNVALACLPEALADSTFVNSYASEICAQRDRLQMQLATWGIRYWPSQANFVLFEVGRDHMRFVDAMRTRGILMRDRSRDPGCDGCVRVTLGVAASDRPPRPRHGRSSRRTRSHSKESLP